MRNLFCHIKDSDHISAEEILKNIPSDKDLQEIEISVIANKTDHVAMIGNQVASLRDACEKLYNLSKSLDLEIYNIRKQVIYRSKEAARLRDRSSHLALKAIRACFFSQPIDESDFDFDKKENTDETQKT